MKTRHIIAIGLLSALAVGILGLAIHTGKAKTKTFQTKAEIQITNLSHTDWQFNQNFTPTLNTNTHWLIEFTSNNETFSALYYWTDRAEGNLDYFYGRQHTYVHNTNGWTNDNYRIISIGNGTDEENTSLINFLYNNATLINQESAWYEEGYSAGQTAGYQTGYSTGYETGETAGYQTGYSAGYETGESTGYQTGYSAGYETGETAGYQTGYSAGETAGYQEGYQFGLTDTTENAYHEGYLAGYGIGYSDSDAFNHPIALQPLMLNILTMPFTFIAQAFDVTLWPGTAYEFNIANFIKGMIAIATIMFIIKLFTSGFSVIGNYTDNHYQNKLTRQKIKESKSRTDLNNRTNPNTKTRINKKG